jgi:hypothetical protein
MLFIMGTLLFAMLVIKQGHRNNKILIEKYEEFDEIIHWHKF